MYDNGIVDNLVELNRNQIEINKHWNRCVVKSAIAYSLLWCALIEQRVVANDRTHWKQFDWTAITMKPKTLVYFRNYAEN